MDWAASRFSNTSFFFSITATFAASWAAIWIGSSFVPIFLASASNLGLGTGAKREVRSKRGICQPFLLQLSRKASTANSPSCLMR